MKAWLQISKLIIKFIICIFFIDFLQKTDDVWYIGIKLWGIFGLGHKSSGLGLGFDGPGLDLGLEGSRPWSLSWPRGYWPWPRPWPLDFGLDYITGNHKTCLSNDESACDVDTESTSDMFDTGESAMEANLMSLNIISLLSRLTLQIMWARKVQFLVVNVQPWKHTHKSYIWNLYSGLESFYLYTGKAFSAPQC